MSEGSGYGAISLLMACILMQSSMERVNATQLRMTIQLTCCSCLVNELTLGILTHSRPPQNRVVPQGWLENLMIVLATGRFVKVLRG